MFQIDFENINTLLLGHRTGIPSLAKVLIRFTSHYQRQFSALHNFLVGDKTAIERLTIQQSFLNIHVLIAVFRSLYREGLTILKSNTRLGERWTS